MGKLPGICYLQRKICENTGFHWPVFSHLRTEYKILSLYGRIRVSEKPYSDIFYAAQSKHVRVNQACFPLDFQKSLVQLPSATCISCGRKAIAAEKKLLLKIYSKI